MFPCDFLPTTCCNWLYRSVHNYLEEVIDAAASTIGTVSLHWIAERESINYFGV